MPQKPAPVSPMGEAQLSETDAKLSVQNLTVPIEVKWNIPAWMMRDPGKRIDVEDDDFEQEEERS